MQGPTSAPTGDGEHCYTTVACNSSHGMNQHELKTAEYQRLDPKPGNMLIRIACEIAELRATLVWRAPEGPEGTGGLRDRPLRAFRLACGDLAGGRARRRPEHQRSRKQQAQSRIPAAPPAWRAPEGARGPGCGARGRRGLAAVPVGGGRARAGLEIDHSEPQARVWRSRGRPGPPAPGTPAASRCGDGGNRTPVPRHSKRGRHQPTPCASALTHP